MRKDLSVSKWGISLGIILMLSLLLSACGDAANTPVPVSATTTATNATLSSETVIMKPVVDKFLTNLPASYYSVGLADLKNMIATANPVLVDVREAGEYSSGHLPQAINLPLRTVTANLDKLPMNRPVVVYCSSSHCSAMAMAVLRSLGYNNAYDFSGGYPEWLAGKESVSKEQVAPKTVGAPNIDPLQVAAANKFLSNMPADYSIVKIDALKDLIKSGSITLVDVRESSEYAAGHIATAINIPMRTLAKNPNQLPTGKPIIVYCNSGHRAAISLASLQMLGYTNARSFQASFNGWVGAGEAVTR